MNKLQPVQGGSSLRCGASDHGSAFFLVNRPLVTVRPVAVLLASLGFVLWRDPEGFRNLRLDSVRRTQGYVASALTFVKAMRHPTLSLSRQLYSARFFSHSDSYTVLWEISMQFYRRTHVCARKTREGRLLRVARDRALGAPAYCAPALLGHSKLKLRRVISSFCCRPQIPLCSAAWTSLCHDWSRGTDDTLTLSPLCFTL